MARQDGRLDAGTKVDEVIFMKSLKQDRTLIISRNLSLRTLLLHFLLSLKKLKC